MHDIIPDIHGDYDRLEHTLKALDYIRTGGSWRHPDGRSAVFLGDFIDTGSQNRKVIHTVREMVARGSAVAVMGNHELNAIHYHTPGKNGGWGPEDGWMRVRDAKNKHQHQAFLEEFTAEAAETQEVIDWFLSLPLFLEFDDFRVVHACWDSEAIALIRTRNAEGRLNPEDLQEVAFDRTDFARAVNLAVKGPEMRLPPGLGFYDTKGIWREKVRLKWWKRDAATWRSAALSVPNPDALPEKALPDHLEFRFYPAEEKPVLVGHYKMAGRPEILAQNATCLDYPKVPCAYRWDAGARGLALNSLFFLDNTTSPSTRALVLE